MILGVSKGTDALIGRAQGGGIIPVLSLINVQKIASLRLLGYNARL